MVTIVEPQRLVSKLWGKQSATEQVRYRLMKYVLQSDYEGYTLLLNVVTGHLVLLETEEADKIRCLSLTYDHTIETLIKEHFLVPEGYDEYQMVISLRKIMRMLTFKDKGDEITHFTILPTTACNARCYYCFEQGVTPVTMTTKTVDKVVNFISSHCGTDKNIHLSWFGGEPTVAAKRIEQICIGLQKIGIQYHSDMTTNGYLFDEELVKRAKNLWNLKSVMICVDGIEDSYNRIKAFVNATDNPYKRIMRNISLLLENEVFVDLRMNFDISNYSEFEGLVQDIVERFNCFDHLLVRAHPIVGAYVNHEGVILHGNEAWFTEKVVELNSIAQNAGVLRKSNKLPCIEFAGCQATNNSSVTITPEGDLVRCPEQFGKDQVIGNIVDGITNDKLVKEWKVFGYYDKCIDCCIFPCCVKIKNCAIKDQCCYKTELINQFQMAVKEVFSAYLKENNQEDNIS